MEVNSEPSLLRNRFTPSEDSEIKDIRKLCPFLKTTAPVNLVIVHLLHFVHLKLKS